MNWLLGVIAGSLFIEWIVRRVNRLADIDLVLKQTETIKSLHRRAQREQRKLYRVLCFLCTLLCNIFQRMIELVVDLATDLTPNSPPPFAARSTPCARASARTCGLKGLAMWWRCRRPRVLARHGLGLGMFEPSPASRRIGLIVIGCLALYVALSLSAPPGIRADFRYVGRRAAGTPISHAQDHLLTAVDVAAAPDHAAALPSAAPSRNQPGRRRCHRRH